MERELTPKEKATILHYMEKHPKMHFPKIIAIFEKKFKTPITETCLGRIIVESSLM
jgi:hypothetical protein